MHICGSSRLVAISHPEDKQVSETMTRTNSVYVFYHFFPPDDVVSAMHFGDLCSGLAEQEWRVVAFPSIWGCRNESSRYPARETWRSTIVRRLWRPRFRQASTFGRIVNATWMIANWSLLSLKRGISTPDVLIIGSDPVMSILVAAIWKLVRPRTKIVYWCFDLYPEAAIADGIFGRESFAARILRRVLRPAYRACSVIADIGPCMRQLLLQYPSDARRLTMVPWALSEPTSPLPIARAEREHVFGETPLAILYSGSFGRAHSCGEILDLAQIMESEGAKLAFSVSGNRVEELHAAVQARELDVRFVPFAPLDELSDRLACADVHVVALRPEWTGTVVPSKFFGTLAVGRPVLFAGSEESSVARWIREFEIGWVLSSDNLSQVASELMQYAAQPTRQIAMQRNCFDVYHREFSKEIQLRNWNVLLLSVLKASGSVGR